MKLKLFSSLALVAMMFAGTSCSSEEVAPVTGESTVTLSVTLPDGIQSRAFGDGTTAQKLTMLVLDQDNKALPVFNGNDPTVLSTDIQLTKQVNLQLAAGKTYKVVCWAAAEGAPYSFDTTDFIVRANYTDATKASDESLDAFYAVQDITVAGNTSETVKLYRPFAQLNIGTDDLAAAKAAGFEAETVTVTVPTYKSLDLLTGKVEDGDPVSQTFAANALPTGEKFPKAGYDYLSMNYILMSTDKQLVDVEFTVNAKDGKSTRTLPVAGVPVQRNYRTNIYGSLLTNSVNINVEIVPDFEEPDYMVYDEKTLAAAINAGKNVTLYSDIELTAPICFNVGGAGEATLDLNGHKIYNVKEIWSEANNTFALFELSKGHLTIKGNGTIASIPDDSYVGWVYFGSKLTIEDGTFLGNIECLYCEEGSVEIKGGRFEVQQRDDTDDAGWMFNCLDANYKNGTANFIITGGEFLDYNPADAASEQPHANYVAPGYKSVKTVVDGKTVWKVVPQEAVKTTEEFLEAAKVDNAVVTVAPNTEIVLSGSKLGKNVTIIGSEGSVLKQDGEFGGDKFVFVYDTEDLTLKNITIDCGNANYKSFARCNDMELDNCTVKGQLCLNGDGITFEGCKFVQTDKDMYNLWSYGGNNVVFNKCTFENVGKAINVYREGAQANVFLKQTFNNCEFKSNPVNKAALNIKTDFSQCWELIVNNCTLTNGMKVYQIDNATKAANQVKLTVDGTAVTF